MRQVVAGPADLYPRDTHGRKLFQTGEIGVGVEVVIARAAAVGVGEGDVDAGEVPARGVEPATQIVDLLLLSPDPDTSQEPSGRKTQHRTLAILLTLAFMIMELVLSRIFYRLRIRKHPY